MVDARQVLVGGCLMLVGVCGGLARDLAAQGHDPTVYGQWEGPYDLAFTLPFDPNTETPYQPTVLEIVHASVLPPRGVEYVGESHYAGKVMFLTDRANPPGSTDPSAPGAWEQQPQPSYVWIPDRPLNIEHILIPNTTYEDVFCCAQTFGGDGILTTVGGLNRPLGGGTQQARYGHGQSFRLRTDLAQSMGELFWEPVLESVSSSRWYPSACVLNDGSLIALGHGGLPVGPQELQREYFIGGIWGAAIDNLQAQGAAGLEPYCSGLSTLNARDYPKVHLLRSQDLMWVDSRTSPGLKHQSWFVKVTGPGECSIPPGNPYRWRQGVASLDPAAASHAGGNSVHLITRDRLDPGILEPIETIYVIGGTRFGEDDKPCPCNGYDATNRVHRMRNPGPAALWEYGDGNPLSPHNLLQSRVNCVTVIGLDGSLITIGGTARDGTTNPPCPVPNPTASGCVHRLTPERLRPIEVFGSSLTDTSFDQAWHPLADQTHKRQYHSVGGLLPDGRVFSAGGTYFGTDYDARRTVEIYRPPYWYSGSRPEITEPPEDNTLQLDTNTTLTAFVPSGIGVNRLALLRNTSMTHGVDFNQRYVELRINSVVLVSGQTNTFTVNFTADFTPYAVPPGWYLLTVVDNADVPSPAVWVFVTP